MHQHRTQYAILMPFQFPRLQNTQSISCPSLRGCLHRSRAGQPQPVPTLHGAVCERGAQKHRQTSPGPRGFLSPSPAQHQWDKLHPRGAPGAHDTKQARPGTYESYRSQRGWLTTAIY